jgi:hypothetical protein
MSGPNITIRGIRQQIPTGYVIGRTDTGQGNVHLIPISHLKSGGGGGGGGGSTTLAGLTDVAIAGQTTNQVLTWNGTKWVNQNAAGSSLAGLSDVTLTSLATNQILQYNGTKWVNVAPSSLSVQITDTAFPVLTGAWSVYTGAFASAGNVWRFWKPITVLNVQALIHAGLVGDVYSFAICTVAANRTITGLVAASNNSYTAAATTVQNFTFTFASNVNLVAGQDYAFLLILTNRTTTTVCAGQYVNMSANYPTPFPLDINNWLVAMTGSANNWVAYAQNSATPSAGTIGTQNWNAQFLFGVKWTG